MLKAELLDMAGLIIEPSPNGAHGTTSGRGDGSGTFSVRTSWKVRWVRGGGGDVVPGDVVEVFFFDLDSV